MTPHAVPDAWPLLLSREQLCAYLGGMDERTLVKILPVQPLDIGANLLRYHRPQIDAWVNTLGPRLPKTKSEHNHKGRTDTETNTPAPEPDTIVDMEESRAASLRRVQERMKAGSKCRKTG